jgi:hypothetical protein
MSNSSIPPAKANKRNQRGIALVIVVLFSSALAGFMMLTMLQLRREHLAAQTYQGIRAASDAADAGLEFAVAKVWDQYLQNLGKDLPVLGGFKGYLDKVVGKLTKDLLDGEIKLASGAVIKAVEVERVDSAESTVLKVTSIAEANGRERRAVQLFTIGGQAFEAFDYALMANNMECVMCHTVVDSVERLNNKDSKNFGSFDRVKIGVLEKMNIETVSARSRIAGSIHSRGQVNVVKSNIFSNLLSSLTVTAFKANSIDSSGKILQDSKGGLSEEYFDFAGVDGLGLPEKNASFYKDYPTTQAEMTDGVLPTSIPAVIKDGNGNRVVDDEEWKEHKGASKGGSISGGLAYGVPKGKAYDQAALPKGSNEAIKYLSTGNYDGNVVLVGTDADPIEIEGDVFVDGDVVITGKVKGTGKIQARRNIYFVGDTTNADATDYGAAKDGTQNLVGYAAGGNIVVGDFITAAAINEADFGKNKWTERNRAGDRGTRLAYLNDETNDMSPPLDKGYYLSWTTQQMMKFNQEEYTKASSDKSYVPRYYQMREGDRTYRFTSTKDLRALQYDSWLMGIMPEDELKRGAVLSMSPDGGWMNEDQLKQIWWNDERSRDKDTSKRGFKIDGLLYTNNALMGFLPSWNRHRSNMYGSLRLRGAAFAADLGILASGSDGGSGRGFGFNLQYDPRVQNLLNVTDSTGLSLKRSVRLFQTAEVKK